MLEHNKKFEFERDPENDMLIGPDGCHYDTEAEALYFDQLNLCGCGEPELVHKFLIDCLSGIDKNVGHSKSSADVIEELIKDNVEIVSEFILHFLHQKNLTEHGFTSRRSWLTERGRQLIEVGPMDP